MTTWTVGTSYIVVRVVMRVILLLLTTWRLLLLLPVCSLPSLLRVRSVFARLHAPIDSRSNILLNEWLVHSDQLIDEIIYSLLVIL